MARLTWVPEALRDVERLRQFLMDKSPVAAARAAAATIEGTLRLRQFPALGRPDELGEFHDLFIPHGAGAYVLRYRLDAKRDVIVVRVWFSREERP